MTLGQQIVDAVFACLTTAAREQYTHGVVPQTIFDPNLVGDDPNAMLNLHPTVQSESLSRYEDGRCFYKWVHPITQNTETLNTTLTTISDIGAQTAALDFQLYTASRI